MTTANSEVKKTLVALGERRVVETGGNVKAWYRKWSDGWIEQGGIKDGSDTYTNNRWVITFPKPFSNTNFTLIEGHKYQISNYEKYPGREDMTFRTTSSATIMSIQNHETKMGVNWYAMGY